MAPLIRPPGHAETASPRKGKLKAHSLIDKVYNEKNLYRAWRKVRANKGTHGLDRVTIRMFESDLDTHLRERLLPLPRWVLAVVENPRAAKGAV